MNANKVLLKIQMNVRNVLAHLVFQIFTNFKVYQTFCRSRADQPKVEFQCNRDLRKKKQSINLQTQ